MSELSKSRVVCAGCRNKAGVIVCGPRHLDSTMRALFALTGGSEAWIGCEQGFVDQHGKFLTREEAHIIATENNQFFRRCGGDKETLYSENLY